MKAFDIILRIIIVVFMFPVDSTLHPPPHFLISTSNSWTHAPPTPRHGIITLLGTITRFPFMWPSSRVRLNRRYVRHCRDICLVIKSGGDKYALKPRYPRGNFARNTSPRSLKPTNLPSELSFFCVSRVYDAIRVQYTRCMRKEKLERGNDSSREIKCETID